MGHRMADEPIDYGNDCGACFAAGKTPEFVYARFSLVKICDPHTPPVCKVPPNDRVFKLTQDPLDHCSWVYNQSGWIVLFHVNWGVPAKSFLTLQDSIGNLYFYNVTDSCVPEGYVFHNVYGACGPLECAYGGLGVVTWTPQATAILEALNIEKSDSLFMELRPLDNGNLVYKFTRIQDAINIKIKFEP